MELVRSKYLLEGLSCADCARKMEDDIKAVEGVKQAYISFANATLSIKSDRQIDYRQINGIIKSHESWVSLSPLGQGSEMKRISADFKGKIYRIILALTIFISLLIFSNYFESNIVVILYLLAYFLVGSEILFAAVRDMRTGKLFAENFLMSIATLGAIAIGEYPEAVAVMLFYNIGLIMQEMAVNRSRNNIKDLLAIKAEYANLDTGIEIKKVAPESVLPGDIILVKPGEKVALDGIIIEGITSLDASALTGESMPQDYKTGQEVLAGMINLSGAIKIRVSKPYAESTVAKILEMVENAEENKAETENFITKFASYYTPVVVFCALALAFIPTLLFNAPLNEWVYRALVFLVISCPCALVVSIPLSFFAGIGSLSRQGVLVKGANFVEALNAVKIVVFDKTGTLTEGIFKVQKIIANKGFSEEEVLHLAALAESNSNHPIARAIAKELKHDIGKTNIEAFEEIPGLGVSLQSDKHKILVGNYELMKKHHINIPEIGDDVAVIYIVSDGIYAGAVLLADQVKADSHQAIKDLAKLGIKDVIMLSGDRYKVVERIAKELNIEKYYAEMLPQDKVRKVEELLEQQKAGDKLLFVGDGINDAPVLMRADIGAVMGGIGAEAAIEAADVVLMKDKPSDLPLAIASAQRTRSIVMQNIIFALGIKFIILFLGALGLVSMWGAVFADVGVTLLAVMNSLRALQAPNLVNNE